MAVHTTNPRNQIRPTFFPNGWQGGNLMVIPLNAAARGATPAQQRQKLHGHITQAPFRLIGLGWHAILGASISSSAFNLGLSEITSANTDVQIIRSDTGDNPSASAANIDLTTNPTGFIVRNELEASIATLTDRTLWFPTDTVTWQSGTVGSSTFGGQLGLTSEPPDIPRNVIIRPEILSSAGDTTQLTCWLYGYYTENPVRSV